MPELKPCPFCGGKPELYTVEDAIWCTGCSGGVNNHIISVEQLIAEWNTRTGESNA